MNRVEEALSLAEQKISEIDDELLRSFSSIIFAPNGTKVPKTSAEHGKPLSVHADYQTIMDSGIIAMFCHDPQASGKMLDAVNIIHEATGGPILTQDKLIDSLGVIIVNALRMREGYSA